MQQIHYLTILFFTTTPILLTYFFYGLRYGAMYMRIPNKTLNKILELVSVQNKTIYDLGAGYGAYTFTAAKQNPTKVYAIEIDPIKTLVLKHKAKKHPNITIIKNNLLNINLQKADIVYCYLFGPIMQKIGEKAKKEMKKNSTLISVEHPIKKLTPTTIDKEHKIYIYQF